VAQSPEMKRSDGTGRFTPGEMRVLAVVARSKGWEWTLRYADRLLDEARAIEGDDLEPAP